MRVVQLTVAPDADRTLPEQPSYPPGWEKVYGAVADETFVAPPDLSLTPVETLDLPPVTEGDCSAS